MCWACMNMIGVPNFNMCSLFGLYKFLVESVGLLYDLIANLNCKVHNLIACANHSCSHDVSFCKSCARACKKKVMCNGFVAMLAMFGCSSHHKFK